MKILYVTTVGSTMNFFSSLIKELIEQGNTVDIATNEKERSVPKMYYDLGCKIFSLSCSRSPLSKGNIIAMKELKKIVDDGKYDIVHCHTPIAAVCTRVACRKLRKNGVKVVYTAHGFHFYKGAPLKNWLIYYPIEWICAYWTDVLITINKEDYQLAKRYMHANEVKYVPGVGVDVNKFASAKVDFKIKRKEIGVPEDAFLIVSVGELSKNKNHQIIIKALSDIPIDNVHYVIAGKGNMSDELKQLAYYLNVNLHLLGYRHDVAELYKIANVYALPSIREGLNVSIMEALASGLPVICSNIRGNIDMIENGVNGYLMSSNDVNCVKECILKAYNHLFDYSEIKNSVRKYSELSINNEMISLYNMIFCI